MVDPDARDWWERRRFRYNIGLVIAGLLAFACYVAVVDRGISAGAMPCAEITLFTTAFQAVGYLFMIGVANVCYFAGPLSETMIKPTSVDRYRRVTFQFGLWLSVLLPFTVPVLVAWSYLVHPSAAADALTC
jgi:hypothetical protein